jgi:glycine/D-amino acid oxidase-like deaminating enzyme
MPADLEVPVLIIGGGPIGLATSILLSRFGIESLLVERHASTTEHPKARGVHARTMELFRQWGVEDAIRKYELPQNLSGFIWVDRLNGAEIGRVPLADMQTPDLPRGRVRSCRRMRSKSSYASWRRWIPWPSCAFQRKR